MESNAFWKCIFISESKLRGQIFLSFIIISFSSSNTQFYKSWNSISPIWGVAKCLISPWGQSWERVLHKHKCIQITARVPKAQVLWCMHECLCKTLSQDCPHGEVAFSNSDINKKKCEIKICQIASFMSTMCKWHLMISFTHSRSVYYV